MKQNTTQRNKKYRAHFVLANYSWVKGPFWGVIAMPYTPLENTDFLFPAGIIYKLLS